MAEREKLLAHQILKVIYAPHKAIKEISQNPKYIGPILIMILFVAANVGFIYAATSKTYVEQILPRGTNLDEWTENSTLWTAEPPETVISENSDHINGTYYGNKSIEFSTANSPRLSMQLDSFGSVNCSGPQGYEKLSIRVKQTSPAVNPTNVTIYLFSSTPSDYFYYNLTQDFNNSAANMWNNLTIPLESGGWLNSSPAADWGNITGLKLETVWPDDSNITLLVDGLFFRVYSGSLFESAGTNYVMNYSLVVFMQFTITWVFLCGIIYIMSRAFGAKLVWKTLLIIVGFTLITMVIQTVINAAAYATLSSIYYPFELIGGVSGEGESAFNKILEQTWLVSLIGRYAEIAMYIWTIALCSLTVRLLSEFTWAKSFLIGTVAYFAMLAARFIIGI